MIVVPVLVRSLYAGNVGSAVRVSANFGLEEVVLVSPVCSTEENEFRQMAVGAIDRVAVTSVESLAEAVSGASLVVATTSGRQRDPRSLLVPEQVRDLLLEHRPERVALVFGPERSGLSVDELRCCHVLCTIPSDPTFPVLNLAQAVAVLLSTIVLDLPGPESPRSEMDEPAPGDEFDAALDHIEAALAATGFLDADNPKRVADQLRRFFGRAVPTRRELAIVRGIAAHLSYIWRSSSARE